MDNLAQVLTKDRTSTTIGSGLCSPLMKYRKSSYLRENESWVQLAWSFSISEHIRSYMYHFRANDCQIADNSCTSMCTVYSLS